jgi:serine/threonine protein kinase/predicted negative regulator of RcsB-dependent stress response
VEEKGPETPGKRDPELSGPGEPAPAGLGDVHPDASADPSSAQPPVVRIATSDAVYADPPDYEGTTIPLSKDDLEALADHRIGPYKLIREVGRGGMGAVYLAVRDDQFQKRVAIKVVKRGMDSEVILRRFRRERQILASLDHPNVARLLDGGSTEDGLPYLVMEYVEGSRLYEYADNHRLDTAERLKLFRIICGAVQYAHQNLIVHRDLKPGNILVTSEGVPKLLDFGIAKLLNPELALEAIEPTATAIRLMTPEYASPEQVRGEPITTASDVYALGVVLYEFLTGHRPYLIKDRSPLEIMRVVCEQEPQRPSTAVTRVADAKTTGGLGSQTLAPESISKTREGEPEKLRKKLSGDLDNIVMKALAKEPQRRYASVDQLSTDIQRHLEGLPVIARPDTFGYRASKFIRRHKASAIAAGLIFASLLVGIVGTTWQARNARQQRSIAERRFNEVRSLANAVMFDLDEKIKNLPGSTDARRFLVNKSLEYLDRLAQESSGDLSLQRELASAYEKVGDVQGGNLFGNIGDSASALESYRKAHVIRQAVATAEPHSLEYLLELARSHDSLGSILGQRGERDEALAHYQQAQAIREPLAKASPSDRRVQRALGTSYFYIGSSLIETGDIGGARDARYKQMTIFEALARAENSTSSDRRNQALGYKYYGGVLERTGDEDQALEFYRKAVAIDESRTEQEPKSTEARLDLSFSYASIAHVFMNKKDYSAALERYGKALALREAVVAADPANISARSFVARAHTTIGTVLEQSGKAESAVESYQKALEIRESMAAGDPENADLRVQLADSASDLGLLYYRIAESKGTSSAARTERLRQARSLLMRSVQIIDDLKSKGKLAAGNLGKASNLASQLAKVQAALAGSPAQSTK